MLFIYFVGKKRTFSASQVINYSEEENCIELLIAKGGSSR